MTARFPVPELAARIETEWAPELAARFGREADDILKPARPWFEFPLGQLRIELLDGSTVQFGNAFHIVDEGKRAIAVFTEHCGNHVYPYFDARVFKDGCLVYEQAA